MSAFVTRAVIDVAPAEEAVLVVRTKMRLARLSSSYCQDQSGTWYPTVPGSTLPPAPNPTTNPNPVPPNSTPLPPGTDLTDSCYVFQDLLPVSEPPVYAIELEPIAVLPPYEEVIPLLGITLSAISVAEAPYALTLPTTTVVAVTRAAAQYQIPLDASAGSFTLSGQAATFRKNRRLVGASGTFAVAGQSSGYVRDYVIGTNAGSFTSAGQSVALIYQRMPFTADAGAFALNGQDAGYFRGQTLFADGGSVALTGKAADLLRAQLLPADSATFSVSGQAASLLYDDFFASWVEQTYLDSWLDLNDWWAD